MQVFSSDGLQCLTFVESENTPVPDEYHICIYVDDYEVKDGVWLDLSLILYYIH